MIEDLNDRVDNLVDDLRDLHEAVLLQQLYSLNEKYKPADVCDCGTLTVKKPCPKCRREKRK